MAPSSKGRMRSISLRTPQPQGALWLIQIKSRRSAKSSQVPCKCPDMESSSGWEGGASIFLSFATVTTGACVHLETKDWRHGMWSQHNKLINGPKNIPGSIACSLWLRNKFVFQSTEMLWAVCYHRITCPLLTDMTSLKCALQSSDPPTFQQQLFFVFSACKSWLAPDTAFSHLHLLPGVDVKVWGKLRPLVRKR